MESTKAVKIYLFDPKLKGYFHASFTKFFTNQFLSVHPETACTPPRQCFLSVIVTHSISQKYAMSSFLLFLFIPTSAQLFNIFCETANIFIGTFSVFFYNSKKLLCYIKQFSIYITHPAFSWLIILLNILSCSFTNFLI